MRILIVGGTVFVGRALTQAAVARGHTVTLLNRGHSPAELPAGVEQVKADRNEDLGLLRGRTWDAVVDTCAYYPQQVESLLAALEGQPHYTLISTISAYADHARPGLTEAAPLREPLNAPVGPFAAATYGPLKSACEQVARKMAGPRCLIIRPGIIIGPHDPTGRFGYWMRRLAGKGDVAVPGDGLDPLQVIDAGDLATWIVPLVEARTVDTFNAVGPREALTFGGFIATARRVLPGEGRPVWVNRTLLQAEQQEGRMKLPLWIDRTDPVVGGAFQVDGRKAWAAGLTLRPLADSIVACHRYEAAAEKPVLVGPTAEEEAACLARVRPGA